MREVAEGAAAPEVRRLTAARRALYLAVLERTGNQRAAAAAIEMDRSSIRWRRQKDLTFDAECRAAEAEAGRRLEESTKRGTACGGPVDGEFEIIRRGPGGRCQIVATAPGRWCKRIEDRFFEVLGETGNASAAARAIGYSDRHIGDRRRQWPGFARRWDEALEEADARLEFRLASLGNNCGHSSAGPGNGRAMAAEDGGAAARARDEAPFDPKFALQYLKWREEKKAGGGRRGALPARRGADEARREIIKRIDAIERHRRREAGREGA